MWHAGHFAYERSVVAVVAVNGIINHKQISVAVVSGLICILPFAVAVSGVAVNARCAHRCRPETVERRCAQCYIAFEEHFAEIEVVDEPLIVYCRSLIFIASCLYILCCTELSARIPFVFCEIADGFSYIIIVVVLPHFAEVFWIVSA